MDRVAETIVFGDLRHGLIWGFRCGNGAPRPIEAPPDGFDDGLTWLHFNLADRRSERWIGRLATLPPAARELLVSREDHQRALVADGVVAGAVVDFIHEFARDEANETDLLRFAIGPHLVVSTRVHPLHCADIIRQRIETGEAPASAGEALNLLMSSVIQVIGGLSDELGRKIESIEDRLLDENREPAPSEIAAIRRRAVQLDRQINGLRAALRRIERDESLPPALAPVAGDLVQLCQGLHGELVAIQQQARLLREELDLRTAQRTNRNLYFLSVMTAMLLPATLVTGVFGMNTGGLPLQQSGHGTALAVLLTLGASALALALLRMMGFFQR